MAHANQGTSVHRQAQGLQLSARLVTEPSRRSHLVGLTVDIAIDPGLHIYGQPVPEGFIPLSIDVTPRRGLEVGTASFPPPTPRQMEGLDETLFIYEGQLTVAIPLTFTSRDNDARLDVNVRYQACGDMGCFMPQTVELHLPVRG